MDPPSVVELDVLEASVVEWEKDVRERHERTQGRQAGSPDPYIHEAESS